MNSIQKMYAKRLAKGQATYESGKLAAEENQFGPKDPGIYTLQLQSIKIDDITTKNGNILVAKIEHLIVEAPNEDYVGSILYDSLWLEGDCSEKDRSDEFIARFFNSLGFQAPENKGELIEAFENLVEAKPVYIAKVIIRDEYNKVYIRKPVETEETEETEEIEEIKETKETEETLSKKSSPKKGRGRPRKVEQEPEPEQEDNEGEDEDEDEDEDEYKNENEDEDEDEDEDEEDQLTLEKLLEFNDTFGLEIPDSSLNDAVEYLKDVDGFDYTEMEKEEIEILEKVGLGDNIQNKPKPKKSVVKKSKKLKK